MDESVSIFGYTLKRCKQHNLYKYMNYMGGRAQSVEVLSALVDRNEKSEGCHLPVIALS